MTFTGIKYHFVHLKTQTFFRDYLTREKVLALTDGKLWLHSIHVENPYFDRKGELINVRLYVRPTVKFGKTEKPLVRLQDIVLKYFGFPVRVIWLNRDVVNDI